MLKVNLPKHQFWCVFVLKDYVPGAVHKPLLLIFLSLQVTLVEFIISLLSCLYAGEAQLFTAFVYILKQKLPEHCKVTFGRRA